MQRAPRRLIFLAALALIGAGVSFYQSQQYYDIRSGMGEFSSICHINEKMNCDAVMASSFSEFIAGFPLSSFAAGWLAAFFFIALLARNAFWRRDAIRVLTIASALGSVFSLIYLYIMAFKLKTFCLFCLGVDAINFVSLGVVLSLKPECLKEFPFDMKKLKAMGGILAGCLLVSVVGLKMLDQFSLSDAEVNMMVNKALNETTFPVKSGSEFPSLGAADAPITLVEFSDFQCPHCRLNALTLHRVIERFPGKIRVVHRNYPLDSGCNPHVPQPMHPAACAAAKAVVCANKQGKFEEVFTALFSKQSSLTPEKVLEFAEQAGANRASLEACLNNSETLLALANDIEEATQLGVESTPTQFLNGHKIVGALPFPAWIKIIETLVAK